MTSYRTYDEQALLRQVATGEETAFRELVDRYADLLATHIDRLTESRPHTEEIVQDVFLKIWLSRETLTDVKNFRTWLYVLSRNQALNAVRSLVRERARKNTYIKELSTTNTAEEDTQEKEAQLSVIDEAIAALPPQQQQVWRMRRQHGMKMKEIATEMGLTESTVKKYMQRATESIIRFAESHMDLLLVLLLLKK